MHTEKIDIEYRHKSGFSSSACDGMCHTKVLPYLSVVQAVEGSYDIQLDNGVAGNTGNGGFFIAPSNVGQRIVHNVDRVSGTMVCRWVFLKVKINDVYSFDERFSFPMIVPDCVKADMHAVFERLFATDDAFEEYVCYHQLLQLLSSVATPREQTPPPYIDAALRYIKEHYRQKVAIEDIARETNLSASHLFAVFKKHTGVSPMEFLNTYRLSIATELLIGTQKSIGQIADEVGIHDAVYFNKVFRKHLQMSPTDYRACYKEDKR